MYNDFVHQHLAKEQTAFLDRRYVLERLRCLIALAAKVPRSWVHIASHFLSYLVPDPETGSSKGASNSPSEMEQRGVRQFTLLLEQEVLALRTLDLWGLTSLSFPHLQRLLTLPPSPTLFYFRAVRHGPLRREQLRALPLLRGAVAHGAERGDWRRAPILGRPRHVAGDPAPGKGACGLVHLWLGEYPSCHAADDGRALVATSVRVPEGTI